MSIVRIFAPVLIGALLLVLIALGAFAWRLSQGPILLPQLTERIERALSALSPDLVAEVSQTEIAWVGGLPELRVVDVKIARRTGEPIASLPALAVRPSLRALAHGEIAVRRLEAVGVNIVLVRDEQGRVLLASTVKNASNAQSSIDVRTFFATESEGGSATQYLKRVLLHDANITFEDRNAGSKLRVERAEAELLRRGTDFDVSLRAGVSVSSPKAVALREVTTRLSATGRISPPSETGGLPAVTVTLKADNGRLTPGGDPGPMLPLQSLVAEANFEPTNERLQVTSLHAALGSAELDGTASLKHTEAGWDVQTFGEMRSLRVPELGRFWPTGAAVAAREWVVRNISDGVVKRCRFAIRYATPGAPPPATTDPVDVSFEYDGLVVHYFGELDPASAIQGTGHISSQGFEARVSSGELGNLHLTNGTVDIKFRTSPPRLTTSADLAGPSGDLLAELGKPPLDIPSKIGLPANGLGGTVAAHVEVEVPLHSGLAPEEVKWTGHADLTDASLANIAGGVGIEKGTLAVGVEDKRVSVEGDTALTGVDGVTGPAHLKLNFEPGKDNSQLKITLEGADLKADGNATFVNGAVRTVSVAHLRFGGNDLSGDVIDRGDDGYQVSVGGESLDLEPFVRDDKKASDISKKVKGAYEADFHLKKVLIGKGIEVLDVNGTGHGEGSKVEGLDATGTFAGGGALVMDLAPRPGGRRLRVRSEQAGHVLKALGVFTEAEGGRLTFIARFPDGGEKDGETQKKPTDSVLLVRDFRVTRAPVLAKILNAGSFTGIADLLKGEGISFSRARLPFRYSDGRLELHDASAVGAMGLTAEGMIDRSKKRIDLHGRVIPSYALNSALGKIPYVGEFLVGGKGEGVFGIEYQVSGSLDQPDVDVNPLTALAPGILRKLFVDPFTKSDDEASQQSEE